MGKLFGWMKRWYWSHLAAISGAAYFLLPAVQTYVGHHQGTAVSVLLGAVTAAFLSRAPKDKP